jgi:hypothetical protein
MEDNTLKYKDFFADFLPDDCGCNVSEDKSTTTYEEYAEIAKETISLLKSMSEKRQSDFKGKEKDITLSYIKSVKIGLGNEYPELKSRLTNLENAAFKPNPRKRRV